MRTALGLAVVLVGACGGSRAQEPIGAAPGPPGADRQAALESPPRDDARTHASTSANTNTSTSATAEGCVVVGAAVAVEGTLRASSGLFSLRLRRPRCVVGLPRSSFLTEVAVATAGPDLRPLVDAPVRVRGEVIAGENDMGGAAVVVLVKDVERLVPIRDTEP